MLMLIIRALFVLVIAGLGVRMARLSGDTAHWLFIFGGVV